MSRRGRKSRAPDDRGNKYLSLPGETGCQLADSSAAENASAMRPDCRSAPIRPSAMRKRSGGIDRAGRKRVSDI